ncbi:MAG: NAD/NADP octopine/nopaline dehydrogenase family protein [Bacteroidales bacterium]|nr:NAD/NADP octopine/nopaline dehydrogenase family protein [Bacteroidales bacterium]
MRFTIVGCGNSGLIHAAKLYEKGFEIALLKTSNTNGRFFDIIQADNSYRVRDDSSQGRGREFVVRPALVTRNVRKAIEFADVIFVMTITTQHEFVAQLIAPYIRDGQIIVIVPGNMGSLIFKKYIHKDVTYCEWETSAYNGRILGAASVRISFYNPRNAVSVLPAERTPEILSILTQCFDNTRYTRKHILESALHNPNTIVHPIGILFSASRIEYSDGEFWMYREAFTPSVINVIRAFDRGKNKLLQVFGCEPLDYFEAAKWRNETDLSLDAMTVFRSFADSSNKGPSTINHRYLNEDVPAGLCLYASLLRLANLDSSLPDGIIALSSALLGKDLSKEGRTIQYLLGRNDITVEDVMKAI